MLWNIDLTLLDVARVTRAACAEAFEKVTGQPLVYLAATSGLSDSEIFFEFLARNDVDGEPDYDLLPDFVDALSEAFANRRDQLAATGRAMPGALAALQAVAAMDDTVQSVVTGSIMPNAVAKLAAFGMEDYLDLSIGGFGSENYPKASLIQFTRMRAEEARKRPFPENRTLYLTDSVRDVEAAVIGRATPVGVLGGSATESQLRAAGARHILADLTDTAKLVDVITEVTGGTEPGTSPIPVPAPAPDPAPASRSSADFFPWSTPAPAPEPPAPTPAPTPAPAPASEPAAPAPAAEKPRSYPDLPSPRDFELRTAEMPPVDRDDLKRAARREAAPGHPVDQQRTTELSPVDEGTAEAAPGDNEGTRPLPHLDQEGTLPLPYLDRPDDDSR